MDAIGLINRLHQHRAWVNDNLVCAAAELSAEQLRSEFPIGQGSVWMSLLHLYAAEYVWLETLLGDEQAIVPGDLPGKIPGNQQGEPRIASLDELRQKWSALEDRWKTQLASLTVESLDEPVARTSSNGRRFEVRRSDALLHVCTHAQYTVAQVVNMLRQLRLEPLPATMLIAMALQERT